MHMGAPPRDRRVPIPGSGAGIGGTKARALVERGWRVAVFDIDGNAAAL